MKACQKARRCVRGGTVLAFLFVAPFGLAASGDEYWDAAFGVPGANRYGIGSIVATGNEAFVGGVFDSIGGLNAANVVKWDGTNWIALAGGAGGTANSYVGALTIRRMDLYIGGLFSFAGETPATNVAIKREGSVLDNG